MTATPTPIPTLCEAPGCDRSVYARHPCERHYRQLLRRGAQSSGWCRSHARRVQKYGDAQAGGGARTQAPVQGSLSYGYHRNGDRLDNLELWSTAQPKGQRMADKLAFAGELLVPYDERTCSALRIFI